MHILCRCKSPRNWHFPRTFLEMIKQTLSICRKGGANLKRGFINSFSWALVFNSMRIICCTVFYWSEIFQSLFLHNHPGLDQLATSTLNNCHPTHCSESANLIKITVHSHNMSTLMRFNQLPASYLLPQTHLWLLRQLISCARSKHNASKCV